MGRGRDVLVVGVDESATGDAALRHTLDEAVLRGASEHRAGRLGRSRRRPARAVRPAAPDPRYETTPVPVPAGPIATTVPAPEETS